MLRIRTLDRRALALNGAFFLALVAGVAVIAFVGLRSAPGPAGTPAAPAQSHGAGPQQEPLPVVEPTILMPTEPDDARKINAAVPFSTAPNPAAAAFNAVYAPDDFQRSVDCLAAAVVYEAGDDADGERAVAQVVLNRVHHPAFPKTICDVVFQGSERTTGCQFTFTCDGALINRTPKPEQWQRAQDIARQALSGAVYAPVGLATHYHTDWVVPYWSSSLDKIVAQKTHLFFRWKGWWGTPPAFRQVPLAQEPIVPALATLSDVHKSPEDLASLRMAAALQSVAIRREGNVFLIGWDKSTSLDILPQLASTLCGTNPECRVVGWPGGETALPIAGNNAAISRASFLFRPTLGQAGGRALWNCKSIKRAGAECLAARDLADIRLLPPPSFDTGLIASALPALPLETLDDVREAAPAVEIAAVATPQQASIVVDEAPTRKRRDPCAAMRYVAKADRIGPCARKDF